MSEADSDGALIIEFESLGAAQAVQGMLESADVPSFVDVVATHGGVPTKARLTVGPDKAHRARWLLAESEFSDRELTYLATGEFNPDDG